MSHFDRATGECVYVASIETDAGTYVHGFHLGTELEAAKWSCADLFKRKRLKLGKRIVTVGLIFDGRLVDVFDGRDWFEDIGFWDDCEKSEQGA